MILPDSRQRHGEHTFWLFAFFSAPNMNHICQIEFSGILDGEFLGSLRTLRDGALTLGRFLAPLQPGDAPRSRRTAPLDARTR